MVRNEKMKHKSRSKEYHKYSESMDDQTRNLGSLQVYNTAIIIDTHSTKHTIFNIYMRPF